MLSDEKTPRVSNEPNGKNEAVDVENGQSGLTRTLQGRHLQFIAIGATFGTGLFLGTGTALSNSGPASLLLAFIAVGALVYSVMGSLSLCPVNNPPLKRNE